MFHRVFRTAAGLCAAVFIVAASVVPMSSVGLAQSSDAKAPDKQVPPAQEPPQIVDEYAEAGRAISGPAGNPECVWLGRRVISLLWRDDIETAFRHLDLYQLFGCPAGHIQATFRCLILHAGSIDPKSPDSLNGRVQACWINPSQPAPPVPAAAAAAPSPTTNR
jgi:hypothetical protein